MLPTSHENFNIWQECRLLLLFIYKITAIFPQNAKICLKAQLEERCVDILANIVRNFGNSDSGINLNDLKISISRSRNWKSA
jgi:hypothetical protein